MNVGFRQYGRILSRGSLAGLGLWALLGTLPSTARAGQDPVPQTSTGAAVSSSTKPFGGEQSDLHTLGTVSGKVSDESGAPVSGARVTLAREGQALDREVMTDDDGQFVFADVARGLVQVTVTSEGLATQTLYETIDAGQSLIIPDISLSVATQMTEVHVGVTPAERADDEVKEEEKQRMFGVIPNFYVSYDPHPVPLTAKMKFELAWKSSSDPFTLGAIAAVAGIEQAGNQWRGYGQGVSGYAKRYGATYGDVFAGTYIGSALLPSLFKQDPRYFYKGTGSKRSRLLHALASSVICRGDNGRLEPNYSNIGGALATGGIANLYYPGSHRNAGRLILTTGLIRVGETAIADVFQEFFIRKVTPDLPARTPTQP